MNKKNLFLMTALAIGSAVAFTGCGDDDDTGTTTMTTADMNVPADDMDTPDMNVPAVEPLGRDNPPTLAAQIDRAGRPGVTTALVGTFLETDEDAREALKDEYNANDDPSTWVASYQDTIRGQLAVLDGLDGVCGNQLAFDGDIGGGTENYGLLASVLANDRVWVNTAKTDCSVYLGYELELLGAVPDGGCGGRIPQTDVIDITYTALAAGLDSILAGSPAVGDGVPADDATISASFPFLAAPL